MSCQATESDLSSVAALSPVLQATDVSHAFNSPLICPGTTEERRGSVCVSPSADAGSLITPCDSSRCVLLRECFREALQRVCMGLEAATSAHITADDMGCSCRARPTININGQEQVDWELSYQGGPS